MSCGCVHECSRDVRLQPFSVESPWNTSLGAGAVFEDASAPMTDNLLNGTGTAYINSADHSIAVNYAKDRDPVGRFTMPNNWLYHHRIPGDLRVAAGTDGIASVIDQGRSWEYWKATQSSPTACAAQFAARPFITGDGVSGGVRASRLSVLGGLIRQHELYGLNIPHALVIALANTQLKKGWVWPATLEDQDAATAYTGLIPMGTLLGIPPTVDLDGAGFTPEGLALARTFQDYGCYVGDRSTHMNLYATPDCEGPALDRMRADLQTKIWPLLRIITNSTPETVGGGGTRRKPPAAPLA